MIGYIALTLSAEALLLSIRMNAAQRREFEFFLNEHETKLGTKPGLLEKFKCWNASLGGRAPKWHWISPVVARNQL
ncbi:hypothetical protein [Undibacterium sp.]|uniref:hypothetical protein n=1 Tax=Undibacterium sp. TaxID=1914977 RepID=UPI0037513D0B